MLDRLSLYVFVVAIFVLSFVLGSLVTVAQLFPYQHLTRAYQGMIAIYKLAEHVYTKVDITATDMWN
jgi:predicted ferric reductase